MRRPLPAMTAILLLASSLLAPNVRAKDASVQARLQAKGMKFEIDQDGDYKLAYSYAQDKRTQVVFVSGRTEDAGGLQVRRIFSPAARIGGDGITEAKALDLLKDSNRNSLGSWELIGEIVYFVIKLPDNLDADQLATVTNMAASAADDMEISISGDRDEF